MLRPPTSFPFAGRCLLLCSIIVVTGSCNPDHSPTAPRRPEIEPLAAVSATVVANPGGPYSGVEGTPITFDGSASTGTGLTYTWDFGDMTPKVGGVTPTHTYADNKTFTVKLYVTDANGVKSSTTSTTAAVSNVPPVVADLTQPTLAARAGTSVSFSTTFTDAGTADKHSGSFSWGDGKSSNATIKETNGSGTASSSHSWSAAGSYGMSLRVVDDDGGADTVRLTLVVGPRNNAPTARVGGPYTGVEGSPVQFDGSTSTDPDGDPLKYDWNFGDGSAHDTTVSPRHTYVDNGTYTVSLTVTDNYGAASTASQTTATIANAAPVISSFTGPTAPVDAGTAVAVQGSFTDAGTLDTHTATLDWGDGSSGPATVTESAGSGTIAGSHSYASGGQFTVRLQVSDNGGAASTSTFVVTINPPAPTTGDLAVATTTTGADPDPDGYTVTVDGNAATAQAIAPNGTVTFPGLTAGSHTVALSGIAANCSAASNPQTVTVTAGTTTNAAFTITCVTTHGDLAVSNTTTGSDLDPDGYLVSVDGGAGQALAVNGSFTFTGLTAGTHTVALSGLAANCTAAANPQTVTVVAGTTTTLDFAITCATIATTGSIALTTATSGADLDPDGYTVAIDGGTPQPIGINSSLTITGVAAGSHSVTLAGLAPNCSVTGANPQTVDVTAGSTTSASFAISCATTHGDLTVTTTTSGVELDPDGYTVSVDGGAAQPIGVNASLTFTALTAGTHTVTLAGLAPNCSAASNPQSVNIVAGSTTTAPFSVTCVATTGALAVTTTTTGADLDPDGYTLSVDGGAAQPIATNGSFTFTTLAPGTHSLALAGVANNCTVSGANPQSVSITAGTTTSASFAISCTAIPTSGAVTVTTATTGVELDPDGYTVTVDGNAASAQPISANGSVTFSGLSAGSHSFALSGLAPNCSAAANPQSVTVVAGTTTTLGFSISCVATTGSLAVSTTTTGSDLDPDGYTVSVDGGAAQPITDNGSYTFTALTPGTHTVTLSGLAANCSTTNNPQTVSITAGATTSASFAVSCTAIPTTGAVTVTTTTTGVELDPDGYTVTVDGNAASAQPVATNGSVTFPALLAGTHSFALSGLAPNCSAATNPQSTTVVAGTTSTLAFAITCVTTHGDLTVTTATTGVDLDPDGYTVSVDGGAAQAIGINASLGFPALTAGTHTVTLAGLAPNCSAAANPQTVTVIAGSTTTLGFSVTCVATTGDLTLTTATTGADLDPNGYTVSVDGGAGQAIATNGSLTITRLAPGSHSVALAGLSSNCSVTSANPQTVTITAGSTTNSSFAISCTAIPTSGAVTVTATTTGVDLDADGYSVTVDGDPASAQPLATNGSVTFSGLLAGSHSFTLIGIAPNCSAAVNPQTVTVVAGSTVPLAFNVSCVTTHGDLTVTTTTTGVELDPDGYTVSVDGGGAQPIGINGSLTIAGLAAGTHTVTLAALAPNCSAAANPQSVTVIAGTTTTLGFAISCVTTHGDLTVTTATTGVELDPDGYSVAVDGGTPQAIGLNASLTFTALTAGTHTVTLSGLAPNCSAASNPQSVTVVAGSTTTAAFSINCVTTHGDVTVATTTTGADLDPDGYTVTVDGDAASARLIATNGSVTFSGLSAGTHSFALSGLAPNCSAAANPQSATVVAGTTTTLGFAITCATTHGDLSVTTTTTGVELDPDGYTVGVDGATAQPIGINSSLSFPGLSAGTHTVTLAGLAPNCSAATNPLTVNVVAGTVTTAAFSVSCVTTHGDLTVTTTTTGVDLDGDGYTVSLDGGTAQTIGINASLSYTGLPQGAHTVTLGGLAPNCSAATNPQTVTVVAGTTAMLGFNVTCVATTGDLTVTTATTGADLDPDGYTVSVDGGTAQAITDNGSITITRLAPGSHSVTLAGVAGNCTVSGANPQTVSITAGATTSATFAVSCTAIPTSGSVTVTTATTGVDIDADGYTVTVDGNPTSAQPIGTNGSVTFPALLAGTHSFALSGLAPNCSAAANPQSVNVVAGTATSLAFSITCVTTHGDLTVTTTTTGVEFDPDGYTVAVDGGAPQPIGLNASLSFTALTAGTHTVTLAGMAPNCTAASNPQTVTVVAGSMVNVAFSVTCVTTHGDVTVTTTTTGADLDPDGYTVTVDGIGASAQPVAANGSVTFSALSAGTHTFTLSGLSPNCSAATNPQSVTVVAGTTTTVGFSVTCVATTGDLTVTTATTGADLDPDGYTLSVDGGAGQAIATNGSLTITRLAPGSHSAALSGLSSNCSATSANPQTVTITAGSTTTASFAISCTAIPTSGSVAVTATTTGTDLDADGYSVMVDGNSASAQPIGTNGSVTFSGLLAGSHSFTLVGIAPNCSAAVNPQTVTVVAGSTVSLAFNLSCVTTHGDLTVTTATSGVELDPDGYTVSVDGGPAQAIGINASLGFPGLTAGTHTVTLAGLAPNCSAAANPQSVTVVAGTTTTLGFSVTCVATTGSLAVSTTTTGSDLDPDGYALSVDGGAAQPIGINGSYTFTTLTPGTHSLAIAGLAANCSTTNNPQAVSITAGTTTSASFAITCLTTHGDLTVTTVTTGSDLDPDGYTVTVASDAPSSQTVATNGSVTFAGLSAGSHTVTLAGLAANCTVSGADPQTVTITAGQTTTTSFAISCTAIPTTGGLTVTTATTGVDLDADGYTVTVDGNGATALAVGINGSVTFPSLSGGTHTVTLSALAPNCSAAVNPQTATVVVGSTTTLAFSITCVTTHGDLAVTAHTQGVEFDPDGYTVTVDGDAASAQSVGVNATVTFSGLSAGTHTVALSGLAANCTPTNNPQTVTIVAGTTTSVELDVTCNPTTGDITATTTTTGSDIDPDGYMVTLDGSTGTSQAIAANGSVTFAGLTPGSHTLTLSGLAANCTTADSPQTVNVVAGATASATFAVTCTPIPTTGDLRVGTTTSGVELDPDGYTVTLDGNATSAQPIGANASITITGLAAGSHTVALSGIAPNCTAATNPQTVTIIAGSSATVGFSITCVTTHGDLTVTTATTGVELDPDGYTVTVDGDPTTARSIAINGSITITSLVSGSHSVSLSGLAANCTAAANPQTVNVVAGSVTTLGFAITCVTTKGSIAVTTSTVGLELDPDGYTLRVDSGTAQALTQSAATNGTATFNNVPAGAHIVSISGLASNCSLGVMQQSVSVTAGATTPVTFEVFCMAAHASTYTFVGAGDIADCARVDDDSTAAVLGRIVASNPGAVVYTLGDNVYDAATATELANCYAPTWGRQKARTFATLGNHDYKIDPNPSWDYFGTRAGPRSLGYYSYNIGDYWHIIVLNDNASYGGPTRTAGSAQDQWLQADLAANTRPCVLAMWHQPFVSSDSWYSASRKIFWDRLYAARADIVLNGHLHYYERMYPQTPDLVRDDANGIRQFIVGTGGASTYTPDTLNVNTVTVAPSRGVLKLTLGAGTYSWEFVWAKGQTYTDSGSGTCH